jgi:SAM-dependent methyltransferase
MAEAAHWERFWDRKRDVSEVYSNAGRIERELQRCTSLDGALVLEVGAGTGRDGEDLARRGARVVELDSAAASLAIVEEVARRAALPLLPVAGDALRLPFADGAFDVVFHQGLLEHFRPPQARRLLQENVRVLRPGGLLCVDVPQRWHPYTALKHAMMAAGAWFGGWERSYTVAELRGALRELELEEVRVYGEWMYPSLAYRTVREALKPVTVLPLYPILGGPLGRARAGVRERARRSSGPLVLATSASIGIVARRPV